MQNVLIQLLERSLSRMVENGIGRFGRSGCCAFVVCYFIGVAQTVNAQTSVSQATPGVIYSSIGPQTNPNALPMERTSVMPYGAFQAPVFEDHFIATLIYGADGAMSTSGTNYKDTTTPASSLDVYWQWLPIPPNDVYRATDYNSSNWNTGTNVLGEIHQMRLLQMQELAVLGFIARALLIGVGIGLAYCTWSKIRIG